MKTLVLNIHNVDAFTKKFCPGFQIFKNILLSYANIKGTFHSIIMGVFPKPVLPKLRAAVPRWAVEVLQ